MTGPTASEQRRPDLDRHGRRRPRGVARRRARPAPPLRRHLPHRARRIRRAGPGRAARDEAARRLGRRAARRLPHAGDERPASSSRRRWTSTRARGACCSPPTPTPAPRSTRSTSSTSTTTCSSRGIRRRRSSTRSSTPSSRPGRATDYRPVPETKVVGHRWSARSSRSASSWPATRCPTAGTRSDSPEGMRLLDAAGADAHTLPLVVTPDGTALVAPTDSELAEHVGLTTTPAERLLRPRRHRRRPGRSRRGGVRRVRGPAHRARRAHGHRRAGRAELAHRELPRLPRRRLRRAADRARAPAGGQVRRRADHHPRRRGARGQRPGPHRPLRRRRLDRRAHVILATGVSYRQLDAHRLRPTSPAAASTTARRSPRRPTAPTRTSTSSAARTRPGRPRSTSPAARGRSRCSCAAPRCEASMSYYLIQQLEGIDNIHVRTCTEVVEAHGDDHLEQLTLRDNATGDDRDGRRRLAVRVHRRRAAHRLARRRRGARRRGFVLAGPDLDGRRAAAGMESGPPAVPPGDERARASSSPATCGPNRPSASRPRSARARWR